MSIISPTALHAGQDVHKPRLFIYLLPLAAMLAFFVVKSARAPLSDFAAYYFGSEMLLHGEFLQVYDTHRLNLAIREQGYAGLFVSYTPFTPFTSLVFSPFLPADPSTAKMLFNIVSVVAFLITVYRAGIFFRLSAVHLILIPIVLYFPLHNNIMFGQAYLLLFTFLVEGFIALRKGNNLACGLWWALAIVFKVFPGILVLYLLFKKQYRAAVITIACAVILLVLSILINGAGAWKFYLGLLPRLGNGELNDSFTHMFQSFFMLTKKLFVYDALLNPAPALQSNAAFVLLNALFKGVLLATAIAVTLKKNADELMIFGTWLLAALLISPNGSSYSLLLLLPLYFSALKLDTVPRWLLITTIFIAANLSVHWFSSLPALLQFPRLLLLAAMFVAVLWICRAMPQLHLIAAPVLLFIVLGLPQLKENKSEGEHLLDREHGLLITDLYVEAGRLGYRYWSDSGEQSRLTNTPVQSWRPLQLQDNQVVAGNRQLTSGKDWKRKPVLINDNEVIYLSDHQRGIGFYTILRRKLR